MGRRGYWNLGLAVLAGLLVLLAWWRPGLEPQDTTASLTRLKLTDISRLETRRPGKPDMVLERNNGDWRMVRPLTARANPFAVSALLSLAHMRSQSLSGASGSPERYGLNPGIATVKLDSLELVFGDRHPVRPLQYLLMQDRVYLVSDTAGMTATRPYTDFLEPHMMPRTDTPERIELPNGSRLLLNHGSWQLEGRPNALSADALTRVVSEWSHATALKVRPRSPSPSAGRVTVVWPNEGSQHARPEKLDIDILAYTPELILAPRNENLQYHFPASLAARLLLH